MSVMWNYLDKKSATAAAIRDFPNMKFIINHTDDEIKKVRDKMASPVSPSLDDIPSVYNPKAGEEKLLNGIDEIDVLKERYRQAVEYMNWFTPAWKQLSDDDQFVLESFYSDDNKYGNSAMWYVADSMNIEPSTAYKRKSRALNKLSVLLFGKL